MRLNISDPLEDAAVILTRAEANRTDRPQHIARWDFVAGVVVFISAIMVAVGVTLWGYSAMGVAGAFMAGGSAFVIVGTIFSIVLSVISDNRHE